jgi:hypothetical protein
MVSCYNCNDTGVIETGNNDLPCNCPAGDKAMFNIAGESQPVIGKDVKLFFLNNSSFPIDPLNLEDNLGK